MLDQSIKPVTADLISKSQSYPEYRKMIDALLAENKTTGYTQSESYLEYTRLNVHRMNRWDKTAKVSQPMETIIRKITKPQVWLVITEAWCGDAAQSIPYIFKLALINPLIQLRLVLRDENPELMNAYLTEGARSIPKLIIFSENLEQELATWGPKPKYLQDRLKAYKFDPLGVSSEEFAEGTHLWYAKDKNQSLERELIEIFSNKIRL